MKRIRQWLPTVLLIFLLLVVLIAVVTVLGIGVFHLLGYTYTSFPSVLLYFGCFVLFGLPISVFIQALVRTLWRMGLIRTFLVKCLWFGVLDVLTSMLLLEMLDLFIGRHCRKGSHHFPVCPAVLYYPAGGAALGQAGSG